MKNNTLQDAGLSLADEQERGITYVTLRTVTIYLGFQALIGFVAIEYAWRRTQRFRDRNEARDAQYPHFRRYDA